MSDARLHKGLFINAFISVMSLSLAPEAALRKMTSWACASMIVLRVPVVSGEMSMVGSLCSADSTVSLMCPKAPLASWKVRHFFRNWFSDAVLALKKKKKKKPHSDVASHTNNKGLFNPITPPPQDATLKTSKLNRLHHQQHYFSPTNQEEKNQYNLRLNKINK